MLPVRTPFGVVRLEAALDESGQPFHLVRSAGATVEMPAEGVGVVEDYATIGQRPRRAPRATRHSRRSG